MKSLFTKITLIFLITLILAIGLTRIGFLIDERTARRNSVVAEIAMATARDQTLVGPVLIVPYTRIVKTQKRSDKDDTKIIEVESQTSDALFLLPTELDIQANLNTEQVSRSLYHAVVFGASIAIKGRFASAGELLRPASNEQIVFGEPRLIVGISDPRGILRAPALNWGDQRFDFQPGTAEERMPNGIQASVHGLDLRAPWSVEFAFALDLRGTQAFGLAPVGDTTHISVRGNWPHPSFYGQFLPETREVADSGFTATWSTTQLATNMALQLSAYLNGNRGGLDTVTGVRFVDPADSYVQSDRAIKYGLLFIGLTFAAFFLFEVLKRLAIHPFQYGLTGAALVLFYLLLLSLSEHLDFGIAYAIATAACASLLSYYLIYVLGSLGWGIGFGALIAAVFGILYVLISLEDHALLAGSATLFALLALAMVLTRKVDWYQLGEVFGSRRVKRLDHAPVGNETVED
ncbi:MAG: cell envelope integrity protein CreD [Candidatus Competibacteraceae bacterium]|nr:MAG: cell envelope integrity protein CreD [Candidatus Competibacteraceae bacterium]